MLLSIFRKKMDENEVETFKTMKKDLVRQIRVVTSAVRLYTEEDVEEFDVKTEGCAKRLKTIRDRMERVIGEADEAAETINDTEQIDQGIKDDRIAEIEKMKNDMIKLVKDNERKVKARAMTMLGEVRPSAGGGGPAVIQEDPNIKAGKVAKLEVIKKQLIVKSNNLKRKVEKVPNLNTLKEQEFREFAEESKEWEKKVEEMQKISDNLEQEGVTLKVDVKDELADFNETLDTVMAMIKHMKVFDKGKGYYAMSKSKAKESIVYPKAFDGTFGVNIFRWCKEMEEALESARLKEEDKIRKLLEYLSGDARTKVGEHHVSIKTAMESLKSYYGNPRAIWLKRRQDLENEVGNFSRDWGVYGSQKRVMAIAKVQEFVREAEILAKEFPDALDNEVYSSNTTALLRKVLPHEYTEKINDTIVDVNKSDKEKLIAIKAFLETKIAFAMLAVDPSSEVDQNRRGNPAGAGQGGAARNDRHNCRNSKSCRWRWHGLGCADVYTLPTHKERKARMMENRACIKCGSDFKKEIGGGNHICKWDGDKIQTKCTAPSCQFGAALCPDHESISNSSQALMDWVNKERISTSIFTMREEVMVTTKVGPRTGQDGHDSLQSSTLGGRQDGLRSPDLCVGPNCAVVGPSGQEGHASLLTGTSARRQEGFRNPGISLETIHETGEDFYIRRYQRLELNKKRDESGEEIERLVTCPTNVVIKCKLASKAKSEGIRATDLRDVPEGRGTFEFTVIRGKTRPLMSFIDTGGDKWFVRNDAIDELVSTKVRDGPIPIRVAGANKIYASAEWGALLPLKNGTQQVVRGLAMDLVAASSKSMDLRKLLANIQASHKDNEELQRLKIPAELGGQIDMIIGQKYRCVHPDPVIMLLSGIEIRKSKFLPWNENEVATICGPITALEKILGDSELNVAIGDMRSLAQSSMMNLYEEGLGRVKTEEIDCKLVTKIDAARIDTDIPEATELLEKENATELLEKENHNAAYCSHKCECKDIPEFNVTQSDAGKFLRGQEIGLDVGFRCIDCRSCEKCKKGAGSEKKSIMQEKE